MPSFQERAPLCLSYICHAIISIYDDADTPHYLLFFIFRFSRWPLIRCPYAIMLFDSLSFSSFFHALPATPPRHTLFAFSEKDMIFFTTYYKEHMLEMPVDAIAAAIFHYYFPLDIASIFTIFHDIMRDMLCFSCHIIFAIIFDFYYYIYMI